MWDEGRGTLSHVAKRVGGAPGAGAACFAKQPFCAIDIAVRAFGQHLSELRSQILRNMYTRHRAVYANQNVNKFTLRVIWHGDDDPIPKRIVSILSRDFANLTNLN